MILIIGVVMFALGLIAMIYTVVFKKSVLDKKIAQLMDAEDEVTKSKIKAKEILEHAEKESHAVRKELELIAKESVYEMKEEAEKEIKNLKNEVLQKEAKVTKKEEAIDAKIEKLEAKSIELEKISADLEERKEEVKKVKLAQEVELQRIAGLSKAEATEIFMIKLKEDLTHDSAIAIKEFEHKLEEEKERMSQKVLATCIGKASADYVVDATVSVITLPNDEMKGRIIGREGRNIRAIEALTGVDIIIDDTPEAVVISSFDGVRREVAKMAIERLIGDGRIHPGKIEELVAKAQRDVDKDIVASGEAALLELGIPTMHPEVTKTLGRLKFRTSYGQNILTHSIEVAKICAVMAAEIGADAEFAKRAGLLHDVGKVIDHEIETSHAIIGAEFLKKYNEKPALINAVMAHHGDAEFGSVEAILVQAADAVSASRPGARRETLSTYIKRLEQLEEVAKSFNGVESSYAIQAGREIRIIINPEIITDDQAVIMARETAKKIEETMQYPGQIKVTILRETRAVDYAK